MVKNEDILQTSQHIATATHRPLSLSASSSYLCVHLSLSLSLCQERARVSALAAECDSELAKLAMGGASEDMERLEAMYDETITRLKQQRAKEASKVMRGVD